MKKRCLELIALLCMLACESRALADVPAILPELSDNRRGFSALLDRVPVFLIAIVLVAAAVVLWVLLRRRKRK